ncbi:rhodanese-like domain-containing protein [Lutibacter sp.]|uniref:rhodanese-like domain-containing protein n=1 Tax=Lutibacter sp. TaxID=1925666 RepID=UPI0025C3E84B|nr:rhodanese-like domain-containing protein [Lutibacter sp.]MCF6181961.1 rhodanese-like domain-containing protein [Lutibacter sp.]
MNKSIKLVCFVLVVSLISLSCKNNNANKNKIAINSSASQTTQQITGKISVLTPAEFKEKAQNNPIIDVRTPFEYSQGYIKGSKNINFFDKDFLNEIASYNKNEPIYVYCKSGHRSGIAVKKMIQLGFKDVYELQGGIINWVRSNNKIEK